MMDKVIREKLTKIGLFHVWRHQKPSKVEPAKVGQAYRVIQEVWQHKEAPIEDGLG